MRARTVVTGLVLSGLLLGGTAAPAVAGPRAGDRGTTTDCPTSTTLPGATTTCTCTYRLVPVRTKVKVKVKGRTTKKWVTTSTLLCTAF